MCTDWVRTVLPTEDELASEIQKKTKQGGPSKGQVLSYAAGGQQLAAWSWSRSCPRGAFRKSCETAEVGSSYALSHGLGKTAEQERNSHPGRQRLHMRGKRSFQKKGSALSNPVQMGGIG